MKDGIAYQPISGQNAWVLGTNKIAGNSGQRTDDASKAGVGNQSHNPRNVGDSRDWDWDLG